MCFDVFYAGGRIEILKCLQMTHLEKCKLLPCRVLVVSGVGGLWGYGVLEQRKLYWEDRLGTGLTAWSSITCTMESK